MEEEELVLYRMAGIASGGEGARATGLAIDRFGDWNIGVDISVCWMNLERSVFEASEPRLLLRLARMNVFYWMFIFDFLGMTGFSRETIDSFVIIFSVILGDPII
jgi:hypothetical protein